MTNLLLSGDPCERPVGGIPYIEIVPSVAIASMAIPSGLRFQGPLTLKPSWAWLRVEFSEETAFYAEKDVNNQHGTVYEIKTGGFYPRDSRAVVEQLEKMKNYYWVARVKDMDDKWRLVGSDRQTLKFSSRSYEITTLQQRRGFMLEMSGIFTRPALFDER